MPRSFISTPVSVTGASVSAPTLIASVQLPHAGKWDVTYFVKMSGTPGHAALYSPVYGSGVTPFGNSEIAGTKGTGVTESSAVGRTTITTTGAITLNLRGWGSYQAISDATGRTGLNAELQGTGPQGIPGEPGKPGAQGPAGNPGPKGDAGPKGDVGAQGPVGATGLAGKNGTNGAQGPVGATGAPGAQGPVGPSGSRGDVGAQGPGRPVTVMNRAPTSADSANVGDIWYQTY